MVSDGAKALIKLALSELGCPSVADLFHALRALSQPLGSGIGRHYSQLKKQQQKLSEQLLKTTSEAKRAELQGLLDKLALQQQCLQESLSTYHQALHAITLAIHPFNIITGDWQLWHELSTCLISPLEQLRSQAMRYGTEKAQAAIDTNDHADSFLC